MKESQFMVSNGSISVCSETDRALPDYVSFQVYSDSMYGTVVNSKELRKWLRKTLNRLERDARRRHVQPR